MSSFDADRMIAPRESGGVDSGKNNRIINETAMRRIFAVFFFSKGPKVKKKRGAIALHVVCV